MMNMRCAAAALSIPALLAAALLALSGCVAPPAAVYPNQPAPPVYPPQPYASQPYAQPQAAPQYYASFCSAGVYQCPVPGATPVGTSCACPGLGAPSYGVAQ